MRFPFLFASFSFAFALALLFAAPSLAAKPAIAAGMHTFAGRVMQVQGGNGTGRFLVQLPAKRGQAAGGAAARGRIFQFGPNTQFVTLQGNVSMPATFGSLAPGTRVRVMAQGHNAAVVQILPPRPRVGLSGTGVNGAVPLSQTPRRAMHPAHSKQASLRHSKQHR